MLYHTAYQYSALHLENVAPLLLEYQYTFCRCLEGRTLAYNLLPKMSNKCSTGLTLGFLASQRVLMTYYADIS